MMAVACVSWIDARQVLAEEVERLRAAEGKQVTAILATLQPQYPDLALGEMKQIFDDTYERMSKKLTDLTYRQPTDEGNQP